MILTKNVEIKINKLNINYYIEKNYKIKLGDLIIIKIEDLYEKSDKEVSVKCDICGLEKTLKYKWYIKNINSQFLYLFKM